MLTPINKHFHVNCQFKTLSVVFFSEYVKTKHVYTDEILFYKVKIFFLQRILHL